jgi:PAS domain S-box-containing protein
MIIVALMLAALMLGLYAATRFISGRSYDRLERREVTSAVDRAQGVITSRITGLLGVARDYARWDDSYNYVRGTDPTYMEENLVADSIAGVGADFMAVVDPDSATVAGRSVDPTTGGQGDVPEYARAIASGAILKRGYNPSEKDGGGIVDTPAGPLLFATARITTTDGSRKSGAYFMIGRLLTAEEIASLSDLARLPIRVFAAGEALGVPPGEAPTSAELAAGKTAAVPLHDGEIVGLRVLRDFAGDPAYTVGVTIPRTVSQAGDRAARGLAWALAIFGVAAGLLVARAMYLQHREVVERTQAEQHARESEERYRGLFDQMADAVFGIDPDGSIVFVNPRGIQLAGTARGELIGAPFVALLSAETAELGTQAMRKIVHRGVAESFEAELVRGRGEVVPVEISAAPLLGEDGAVTGAQWIVRDVTDRKRFEEELVHLASRDHLTGLYNRRRFEEELADQLEHAKRAERPAPSSGSTSITSRTSTTRSATEPATRSSREWRAP